MSGYLTHGKKVSSEKIVKFYFDLNIVYRNAWLGN